MNKTKARWGIQPCLCLCPEPYMFVGKKWGVYFGEGGGREEMPANVPVPACPTLPVLPAIVLPAGGTDLFCLFCPCPVCLVFHYGLHFPAQPFYAAMISSTFKMSAMPHMPHTHTCHTTMHIYRKKVLYMLCCYEKTRRMFVEGWLLCSAATP